IMMITLITLILFFSYGDSCCWANFAQGLVNPGGVCLTQDYDDYIDYADFIFFLWRRLLLG
ncbi:hypothetical protein, partial [Chitinophaga sp.]|uniref:hypothetical protein n=1 Tax=Chitinophaga sp. TaxID=1869181 RepID=UPI002F932F4D